MPTNQNRRLLWLLPALGLAALALTWPHFRKEPSPAPSATPAILAVPMAQEDHPPPSSPVAPDPIQVRLNAVRHDASRATPAPIDPFQAFLQNHPSGHVPPTPPTQLGSDPFQQALERSRAPVSLVAPF